MGPVSVRTGGLVLVISKFEIVRSRATEPLFYSPPHPENMTPFEYQKAGVEFALSRPHALFGDAPGLGKTAECILLGNAIEAKRTLVICPASLRLNWEREIWKWSTIENVSTYVILKGRDGVSTRHCDNELCYVDKSVNFEGDHGCHLGSSYIRRSPCN